MSKSNSPDRSKSAIRMTVAFGLTALMLTVIAEPIHIWPLGWIALLPFAIVCKPTIQTKKLIISSYIVGLLYWLVNLYWINYPTTIGWISLCICLAFLWPLLAMAVRFCRLKNMPLFIVLPILVVACESLQGFGLGGFRWQYLGHSQYSNITLIQIADIFGDQGITFLVAAVNGLIVDIIITPKNNIRKKHIVKISLVTSILILTFIYGNWRINQTANSTTDGPIVGAIQPCVEQSLKDNPEHDNAIKILANLLKKSNACKDAGATIIAWPESMVNAVLDERILRALPLGHDYHFFNQILKNHAGGGTYIIAGALGGVPHIDPNNQVRMMKKFNSCFLYNPDGTKSHLQYDKIHLVPFGEVLPFTNNCPWLGKFLKIFTPDNYDDTMGYGQNYTIFTAIEKKTNSAHKFAVLICYEDTVASLVKKFAVKSCGKDRGKKQIDFLVNISNDGWYIRYDDSLETPVKTSNELAQHTVICAFRAVENRLPILRSVNGGISCLIDSTGRIKNGYLAGSLPKKAFERTGKDGWFVDKIQFDSRTSFFSRFSWQWLVNIFRLFLLGTVSLGLLRPDKAKNLK